VYYEGFCLPQHGTTIPDGRKSSTNKNTPEVKLSGVFHVAVIGKGLRVKNQFT